MRKLPERCLLLAPGNASLRTGRGCFDSVLDLPSPASGTLKVRFPSVGKLFPLCLHFPLFAFNVFFKGENSLLGVRNSPSVWKTSLVWALAQSAGLFLLKREMLLGYSTKRLKCGVALFFLSHIQRAHIVSFLRTALFNGEKKNRRQMTSHPYQKRYRSPDCDKGLLLQFLVTFLKMEVKHSNYVLAYTSLKCNHAFPL